MYSLVFPWLPGAGAFRCFMAASVSQSLRKALAASSLPGGVKFTAVTVVSRKCAWRKAVFGE